MLIWEAFLYAIIGFIVGSFLFLVVMVALVIMDNGKEKDYEER